MTDEQPIEQPTGTTEPEVAPVEPASGDTDSGGSNDVSDDYLGSDSVPSKPTE